MPVGTARRVDSAAKRKGRTLITSSSPANFVNHDMNDYKASDWRAQLLSLRHNISPSISSLIFALHFGEASDV